MGILIPLLLIFLTCLVIWRACDGFEIASEYAGRNLSEGVRGGTINAISSSIPELFTTLIALFVLSDKDGFAVGIGTTAGSALFNGMIIPASCILVAVFALNAANRVKSVDVSPKVILRDGLFLIAGEALLIVILSGNKLVWWQGLVLIMFYVIYLKYMLGSMKRNQIAAAAIGSESATEEEVEEEEKEEEETKAKRGWIGSIFYWMSFGPLLDLERAFIREKHRHQIKNEVWNPWPLLLTSVLVIAVACYTLVKACEWLGTGSAAHPSYELFGYTLTGFGMPPLFVAVIFASMATSVPDTVMSIRDARDGDYDDAVANALGSNIFDICFALGFPLFLYTVIYGAIEMTPDVATQSTELRSALLVLTIVGFLLYFVGPRIKKAGKTFIPLRPWRAVALLVIYAGFVVYVVARGNDQPWALKIAEILRSLIDFLPKLT
jgi:Ca2+/Na+ antiporter